MRIVPLLLAFAVAAFACGAPPSEDDGDLDVVADLADDAAIDDAEDVSGDPTLVTELTLADDDDALEGDAAFDDSVDEAAYALAAPEEAEELDARAADDAVRTSRLRVLAWNIAGSKENACEPDRIRRAVMRFVRDANGPVDVVALSEVCPSQFKAIRRALRRHWGKGADDTFAAYVADNESRVGNALFSRRNLRTITRHKVGQDQYGERHLLCGRQVDRRVRVCSVHLTPGDAKARTQLERVRERLEGWWQDQRDTVIAAGDFNLLPNDPGMNEMYAAGADTQNNPDNRGKYREWDDDDAQHCRGYGERSLPTAGGGPCGIGRKIDFIFARKNRIVDGAYGADTLDIPQDCTGECSDHRAIRGWAKLRYRVD